MSELYQKLIHEDERMSSFPQISQQIPPSPSSDCSHQKYSPKGILKNAPQKHVHFDLDVEEDEVSTLPPPPPIISFLEPHSDNTYFERSTQSTPDLATVMHLLDEPKPSMPKPSLQNPVIPQRSHSLTQSTIFEHQKSTRRKKRSLLACFFQWKKTAPPEPSKIELQSQAAHINLPSTSYLQQPEPLTYKIYRI